MNACPHCRYEDEIHSPACPTHDPQEMDLFEQGFQLGSKGLDVDTGYMKRAPVSFKTGYRQGITIYLDPTNVIFNQ